MSMYLESEPHSWYMGFAILIDRLASSESAWKWCALADNGMTGYIDELTADTLADLHHQIKQYHLERHNGYGERIAKRRLDYLRNELHAARMSYGEIAELESLTSYIDAGDVELLEAAGVPEFKEEQ